MLSKLTRFFLLRVLQCLADVVSSSDPLVASGAQLWLRRFHGPIMLVVPHHFIFLFENRVQFCLQAGDISLGLFVAHP